MVALNQNQSIPVPSYPFDQKNEMFKRSDWDKKLKSIGKRHFKEAKFGDRVGFRQIDYAFRFGAWNIEANAAFGNLRSDFGLYAWEGTAKRFQHWLDLGIQVNESPEDMKSVFNSGQRYATIVLIASVHVLSTSLLGGYTTLLGGLSSIRRG